MQPKPYIFFNGQARDAVAAYQKILGAKVASMMTMADAPPGMNIAADQKDWIMHCELTIGDGSIYLSDDFMANSPAMDGCSVMMSFPTAAEAKTKFDALAVGGMVRMAWEPTFWSAGFGTLTDKFGIRWMIGCDEVPS